MLPALVTLVLTLALAGAATAEELVDPVALPLAPLDADAPMLDITMDETLDATEETAAAAEETVAGAEDPTVVLVSDTTDAVVNAATGVLAETVSSVVGLVETTLPLDAAEAPPENMTLVEGAPPARSGDAALSMPTVLDPLGGPALAGSADSSWWASRDAPWERPIIPPPAPAPPPPEEAGEVRVLAVAPPHPLDTSPAVATLALTLTALAGILARLFSRFGRREVLAAKARADLHGLIGAQPGLSIAEIARASGAGRGAIVHHCRMLERHGLIVMRQEGASRRAYPAAPLRDATPAPTAAGRRVIEILQERGPLTQGELATVLGVTPQAVSIHLLRLRREAHVEKRNEGGQRRWMISSQDP